MLSITNIKLKQWGEEAEEQEKKQMILFSTDPINKKKGLRALAGYGKKAIPLIQELRSVETNEDMKNYMFDVITQINKNKRSS